MLLALDVGNTNITAGVFAGGRLKRSWRHQTRPDVSVQELGRQLQQQARDARFDAVVYGSVVPALDETLRRAVLERFHVHAVGVGPQSRLGLKLKVKHPSEVGADRVLNALAALSLYGGPAVVIDFGTATTFDCLSSAGAYLGGAILPGPNMAAQALREKTAKLPLVRVAKPARVIGRDTVECIEAGLYFGYLGMIENVLRLTLREMRQGGERGRVRVIATGGLAALFRRDLPKDVIHAPDLTLDGLRLAYDRLTGEKRR